MDNDEWLRAEIAKLNFLMELLWTEELFSHGQTPDDVPIWSERVLSKWDLHNETPPTESDEYISMRLAEFCARVQQRLAVRVREANLRRR